MMTESCYMCGVRLEDYFRQLCPKCREAAEIKAQRDADEAARKEEDRD